MGKAPKTAKLLLSEGRPYYSSYDNHYAALYEQGIPYWSAGPNMDRNISAHLDVIRKYTGESQGKMLLEVGCGEGYVGIILTEIGYQYTGIDYSPNSIAKARVRANQTKMKIDFRAEDIFHLSGEISGKVYDIVLDWACLNCFVIDEDRRRYFEVIKCLLSPKGQFILIHEALEDYERFDREITCLDDWRAMFDNDLSGFADREAWDGEKWVPIQLPHFITRCKTEKGYLTEFQKAGFNVEHHFTSGSKDQYFNAVLKLPE